MRKNGQESPLDMQSHVEPAFEAMLAMKSKDGDAEAEINIAIGLDAEDTIQEHTALTATITLAKGEHCLADVFLYHIFTTLLVVGEVEHVTALSQKGGVPLPLPILLQCLHTGLDLVLCVVDGHSVLHHIHNLGGVLRWERTKHGPEQVSGPRLATESSLPGFHLCQSERDRLGVGRGTQQSFAKEDGEDAGMGIVGKRAWAILSGMGPEQGTHGFCKF